VDVGAILGTVIAMVLLVVGVIIVNDVITDANFGGGTGTLYTVTENIPILLAIGGLVLAIGWIAMR